MALLRVKRRLQDDPIDLLLLSCKKFKTEDNPVTKVFKFAATVDEQEGDIRKHITEVKSAKRQPIKYKEHSVTAITEKLRNENKLASHENRLKVVNWFRAVGDEGTIIGDKETYTVVDLVNSDGTKTSSPANVVIDTNSEKVSGPLTEEQYVYDLYYSTAGGDFDDLQIENLLSIHAVNEELIFGDYMNDKDDDTVDEDEDSNDENNWRNDYPDEASDDDFSSDEENMMRLASRMKNIAVDDGEMDDEEDDDYRSDLSSDDGDSLEIYSEQDRDQFYHSESSHRSDSSLSYYSTD
ncbi:hypothetical protein O3M35_004938 [Rhynocoris fuscipes]|uniref:Probable RNA polymerase II nuclear localization protein SLC7A6OS n=1 Tax=Rhynocoris fuscipes TaxID=488301 RepID=A0AAW1DGX2_9HEMI